jgi:tRNA(Ile)-lysidine synthase
VSHITNANSDCIFVDEDDLQFPLTIRKWKEGDYFYPIGMQGKKKLSKYYKDEKYSLIDKLNQWILCSNNQIVWVIGKRQDDRFKITENTKNKLQIKLQ